MHIRTYNVVRFSLRFDYGKISVADNLSCVWTSCCSEWSMNHPQWRHCDSKGHYIPNLAYICDLIIWVQTSDIKFYNLTDESFCSYPMHTWFGAESFGFDVSAWLGATSQSSLPWCSLGMRLDYRHTGRDTLQVVSKMQIWVGGPVQS